MHLEPTTWPHLANTQGLGLSALVDQHVGQAAAHGHVLDLLNHRLLAVHFSPLLALPPGDLQPRPELLALRRGLMQLPGALLPLQLPRQPGVLRQGNQVHI